MSTLVFVEHPATLPALRAAAPAGAEYLAFSAPAALALETAGLSYRFPEEAGADHDALARGLQAIRRQAKQAMARLDALTRAADRDLAARDLSPFTLALFDTEVPVLALATRLLQVAALARALRPDEIIAADFGPLAAPDVRYIDDGSLISTAAARLEQRGDYRCRLLPAGAVRRGAAHPPVAQPQPRLTREELLRRLRVAGAAWRGRMRGARMRRMLNVGCHELRCCDAALAALGWQQRQFPGAVFAAATGPARTPYAGMSALQKAAAADPDLGRLLTLEGTNVTDLLLPALLTLTARFVPLCRQHDWLDHYVRQRDWDTAVFPSHASWYPQHQVLPLLLRRHGVPYACWMHGGLGTNASEAGYGSADFLLGDRFFVYGEGVRATFAAHYGIDAGRVLVTGSPWLEQLYPAAPPRPAADRPRVVVVLGTFALPLNDIHTCEAQRELRSGFWRWLTAVLPVLARHQEHCEIIIRPYHGPESEQVAAVRALAERCGLHAWRLVPQGECRLRELLRVAAAVVLPWVSTSFFEAALTGATLFLGNDSDLTAAAAPLVAGRARLERDPQALAAALDAYLAAAAPPAAPDAGFARAFLDSDHRDRRAARVAEALEALQ